MDKLAQAAVVAIISILVPSIIWCIAAVFKKSKNNNRAPLPPGPRGLPILGYLPFLGFNLHSEFAELARRYGPIFKLQLGSKLCVVLSSPPLVKEVTRDQDITFANRDPPVAAKVVTYGGFDIAWSSYGPYWTKMRKVFVREMLGGSNLDAGNDLRKDEVMTAIRYVSTRLGTPVGIGELTFQTETNLVMSMLWGGTLDAKQLCRVGDDFRAVFIRIVDLLLKPNLSDFFPILSRFDIQGIEREATGLSKIAENIFDAAMNERARMAEDVDGTKNNGGRRKDFIQILHDLNRLEDTGEEITLTQKKAILMDIVVGGTDTTATMTEWAMTELLHHREVLEKVQKELDEVVGVDKIVEEFHLKKLHYLEAVVKETFRLHPAVALLVPRRPSKSCVIGGYTIPKDTRVFINAWAIQRDPELWDDPLEFRPERFLMEPKKWDYSGNNFQYIPFGSGRRVCPGIPLAERMLMHLLASLLHAFDWKPTKSKEEDLSEKFGIVVRKQTPLLAIPTKRTQNQYY